MKIFPGPSSWRLPRAGGLSVADAWITVTCLVVTVAWALAAGKDLNWDQTHYHFYVAYSLLDGRMSQDFMAANAQSYLNPLAYVPFYWMVMHDWHSIVIASVLALFHGLNIILAYFILKSTLTVESGYRTGLAVLGAALALLSPMFLTEAGTTFADITTAVLLLAATWYALNMDVSRLWPQRALLAGALAGAAGGLKLSNLVFGPAFAVLMILLSPSLRASLRPLLLLGTGALAGFVATHGYWSWQLLLTFGDPTSPTLGSILGPADVPPASTVLPLRFLREDLLEGLALPFRMMELRSWIYSENTAPDLRFAAAIVLCVLGTIASLRRARVPEPTVGIDQSRKPRALLFFFLTATALWIWTSSNGRYGIFVSILCGPILILVAQWSLRKRAVVVSVLLVLSTLQLLHMSNGQLHWVGEKWTRSWYEMSVPERLVREPYLYVSVGGNSKAYVAPYLARQSAFVNALGQLSLDLDEPGGKHLQALFDAYEGRVRVIAEAGQQENGDAISRWARVTDSAIARFGFAVDTNDCLTISSAAGKSLRGGEDGSDGSVRMRQLRTCALIARPYERGAERNRVTKVVRQMLAWCPKLFRTTYSTVDEMPEGWFVSYAGTDSTLLILPNRILLTHPQTSQDLLLGTIDFWESGQRPDCAAMPSNMRKAYAF